MFVNVLSNTNQAQQAARVDRSCSQQMLLQIGKYMLVWFDCGLMHLSLSG